MALNELTIQCQCLCRRRTSFWSKWSWAFK